MAYNRRLFLQRVLRVQEITLEYKKLGFSQKWIYDNHIFPLYQISKSTFDSYLGINARREISDIKRGTIISTQCKIAFPA
jgi:hypothetical protein